MMTESDLTTLISDVCRDAGKSKGIEFHSPAPQGAQVLGRWEVSCCLKRQGWSATLRYWLGSESWLSEEVVWSCALPSTLEQSEKFKSDISSKIDLMLEWVKKE
jgi:hypothetical protein